VNTFTLFEKVLPVPSVQGAWLH